MECQRAAVENLFLDRKRKRSWRGDNYGKILPSRRRNICPGCVWARLPRLAWPRIDKVSEWERAVTGNAAMKPCLLRAFPSRPIERRKSSSGWDISYARSNVYRARIVIVTCYYSLRCRAKNVHVKQRAACNSPDNSSRFDGVYRKKNWR